MVTLAEVFRASGYTNKTAITVCRTTLYPQETQASEVKVKAVDQLFTRFHFAEGMLRKAQS